MRLILFVITTQENMGDLALCQEWIGDLTREEYRFAFILSANLAQFVDPADTCFLFDPRVDVGDAIADAASRFRPDAIILASNSFWNMRNQRGAKFGHFPPQLYTLGIPLLSFDPFEMHFRTKVPHSDKSFEFPAIPPGVWALRYMSRSSSDPYARHFCTRQVFAAARTESRDKILRRFGADPGKKTVVFPVSENRLRSIMKSFHLYYLHLARLFSFEEFANVQFLVVSPTPVPGLRHASNVIHVPHIPFHEFLSLVAAADVYLSDSLISCMVNGFHLAVPVMLLVNTEKSSSLARGTFLDECFFPYKVFPYGFTEVCDQLVEKFEIQGCFVEAEILNEQECRTKLGELLFNSASYAQVSRRCQAWKNSRLALPAPRQVFEEILEISRQSR
jgi:hypothetical protein